MNWDSEIDEIKQRRKLAKQQGGKDAIKAHHEKGRLTIRERIDALLDKNSFDEIGEGAGVPDYNDKGKLSDFQPANFILGFGRLDGRKVIVGGEDFTVRGGSPNPAGLRKSVYTERRAGCFGCAWPSCGTSRGATCRFAFYRDDPKRCRVDCWPASRQAGARP